MQANNEQIAKDTARDCLYEKIADLLEDDIICGNFQEQKLPSEQNLAIRYHASRTIIREALKILSERRLVTSLVGSGAFITKPDAYDLSVVLNRLIGTHDINYLNAFDIRIILETAAASRAAQFITEGEIEELEEILVYLKDTSLQVEKRNSYDFRFHMLIAQASHNPLLALLAEAMGNIIFDIITFSVAAGNARAASDVINHGKIVRALKERDPIAAEHMMYDHLYNSKVFYQKYIEEHKLTKIKVDYETRDDTP